MDNNYYKVGHQGLAAFLMCNGNELQDIRMSKDNRPQYLFDMPYKDGKKEATRFFDDHETVMAVDFYQALSDIRKRLYDLKGSNR
jgi:hypothetical protein